MKKICAVILLTLIPFTAADSELLGMLDDPILGLLANSAVDIVWDGKYVWVGTSKGLSGYDLEGAFWRSYNSTNGLNTDEISALAYDNGKLWASCVSFFTSQGQLITVGEGFNITSDYGDTFVVDTPHQSMGAGMPCYDISIYDSVTYAACWYGGLIYKEDGEEEWENLFPDSLAEQDFLDSNYNDLNNRFFCVYVDGNYEGRDTVVVWAGSAYGINQFQFIDPPGKLSENHINKIVHSVDDQGDPLYTWVATTGGLSRSGNGGASYRSFFKDDGLTADFTSAVAVMGDFIITAGYDPDSDSASGFAYSMDNGESWDQSYPEQAVGEGKKVEDIIITKGTSLEIWAACSRGGLIRSTDMGENWEKIILDEEFDSPDSLFNQIISLTVHQRPIEQYPPDYNYILAGCNLGLWAIPIDRSYDFQDSLRLIRLEDIEESGRRVVDIEAAVRVGQDEIDTLFEWAIASRPYEDEGIDAVMLTVDLGYEWTSTLLGGKTNDLAYSDNGTRIWAALDDGLMRYQRQTNIWIPFTIGDPNPENPIVLDTILTVVSFDELDTLLWAGSEYGVAQSPNAQFWSIDTVNLDQSVFDYNIRSTFQDNGLSGDFVVALEVQYYDGDRIIWAAGNSAGTMGEANGISVSYDNAETWEVVMTRVNAWNFAFDGGVVYAATSHGLLRTSNFGETWDTLTVVDLETGDQIFPGTEFYGVALVEGSVWAASDDGIASSPDGGDTWTIYRTFIELPDEEGFAAISAPLPASPYSSPGGRVSFIYRFEESGNITIEIFDFAMDLVATPVRDVYREGGETHSIDSWHMRNDRGRIVATGVYYFKVSNSSGEEEWGKILVIP